MHFYILGSIIVNHDNVETQPAIPILLFGTVNGQLGLVAKINPKYEEGMKQLERSVLSLGHLSIDDHSKWRSLASNYPEKVILRDKNFIDAEIIESFLSLSDSQKLAVFDTVSSYFDSIETLSSIIFDLLRIH